MKKLKRLVATRLLALALRYAARGWHVFPLHEPLQDSGCSCGNSKCGSVGKHPRTPNGFKDATDDSDTIQWWWRRWPSANIGIATGEKSNLVVVDLDIRDKNGSMANGVDEFERLRERWPGLADGPMVMTANGGHIYYARPGRLVRCTQGVVAPGIDVKGDGGYVVAAGSLHGSGERYEPLDDLFEAELSIFPPELEELNEGSRKVLGARAAVVVAVIPDGARNTTLFKLACRYRGQGMSGAYRARLDDSLNPLGYDGAAHHLSTRLFSCHLCPEWVLPYSKETIEKALRTALRIARDHRVRRHLTVDLERLKSFVPAEAIPVDVVEQIELSERLHAPTAT